MEHGPFKQRIVGGLVLVALVAIFIPLLLDMHEGGEWWGADNIPKKPANGFVTRVLPLDEWSKHAQSDMAAGSKQMDAVPPHGPPPVAGAPDATGQAATSPAPLPSVSQPPAAAALSSDAKDDGAEGWVVQLGSFSNQKNANELVAQLRSKTYQGFVEKIVQDGQSVYRVRIGPQRQRADAERIRDRLSRELQLKAIVLRYP